ncbi:DUF4286 family protein [Mucilaginibacter sp. HMF5004]|uniref:DUF4286 family protein n=1 Tax=Mucilaginibacter rivuli TaxID=2857527 RepID=UPI001C5EC01E|nr:DUF4286 family protein [Mucilaginibacter rivuli]MBW4890268.1 DUF4286 family protein [Mucilaginibacter rivuli]
MIILNETIIIDETINAEWLNWMKTVHIPAVMATGHFNSYKILTVLSSPNEGITYCVQYTADGIDQYNAYNEKHSTNLKNKHFKQFENKFVQFESIMQLID